MPPYLSQADQIAQALEEQFDPDYLINFPSPDWQAEQMARARDNDVVIAQYLDKLSVVPTHIPAPEPELETPPWWDLRAAWEPYPRWWNRRWRKCHANIASLERDLKITRYRNLLPWESRYW